MTLTIPTVSSLAALAVIATHDTRAAVAAANPPTASAIAMAPVVFATAVVRKIEYLSCQQESRKTRRTTRLQDVMARDRVRVLDRANGSLVLELLSALAWLELRSAQRQDERAAAAAPGQLTRFISSTRTDETAAARMSADGEDHSNCAASHHEAQPLVPPSSTSPRTTSPRAAFLEGSSLHRRLERSA